MSKPFQRTEPMVPSNKEVSLAEKSSRVLSDYLKQTNTPTLQLINKEQENKKIILPTQALQLLVDILEHIKQGNTVSIISIQSELTTQQAADILNVSRPYLIHLLEEGIIPHRKVGTKRRILSEDIIAYKTTITKKRLKALESLSKQAQDLDLGY